MSRGTLRFRLGPIPVEVSPGFWLIAALLGMSGSARQMAVWVVVVFVSVLVHELGHASAVLVFGGHPEILLHGMGGVTKSQLPTGISHPRLKSSVVTLAGPFAGFVFGLVAFVPMMVLGRDGMPRWAFDGLINLVWVNVGWGVVNLLPIMPLDGGNLVRALLSGPGPLVGYRRSLLLTVILAPILAVVAFYFDWRWAAFLFALFAFQSFQTLRKLGSEVHDVNQGFDEHLRLASEAIEAGDWESTVRHALPVLERAKEHGRRVAAAHMAGFAYLKGGHAKQALGVLEQVPVADVDPMLYGMVLLEGGDASRAVPHLRQAYEDGDNPDAAQMYVRALRESGDEEGAAEVMEQISKGAR